METPFSISESKKETATRQCYDCGAFAPQTQTNYTLISAKFGWRLSRRLDTSGRKILEWRCPSCWENHKKGR